MRPHLNFAIIFEFLFMFISNNASLTSDECHDELPGFVPASFHTVGERLVRSATTTDNTSCFKNH